MKNVRRIIILLVLVTSFGCEDVIEVDLPTEDPRLIVDAIVRINIDNPTTLVTIKVAETNSFFETLPPASLQQVTMSNLDNPGSGDSGILLEIEPNSGIYQKSFDTQQLMEDRWFLQIDFENEIYVANAQFNATTPFDSVVEGNNPIFDGDTEVVITFTDEPDVENFYLFDFDFDDYLVTLDEFYDGQQFEFSYYYDNELVTGDEINISIMGIDEPLFNYMDLLIEQSEGGFGPFQTPAITVRGNIINATDIDNDGVFDNVDNPNNFALGYFALVQEYTATLIKQ